MHSLQAEADTSVHSVSSQAPEEINTLSSKGPPKLVSAEGLFRNKFEVHRGILKRGDISHECCHIIRIFSRDLVIGTKKNLLKDNKK